MIPKQGPRPDHINDPSYDPASDSYELYNATQNIHANRLICRRESENLVHWTPDRIVLDTPPTRQALDFLGAPARIVGFLDPFADPLNTGHQAVQSLVALGTGGWFGVGLGASRARWSFLPNAHSDFIFSIIGEETGLAGSLAVIALFIVLAAVGTTIALRCRDAFGRLMAI